MIRFFKNLIVMLVFSATAFVYADFTIEEPIRDKQNTYWLQLTDILLSKIPKNQNVFEEVLPDLSAELRLLREDPIWLELWGTSLNYEKNVNNHIVDSELLLSIGELAGWKEKETLFFHAGLLHTYGYLFSKLSTPYGYKRERWI